MTQMIITKTVSHLRHYLHPKGLLTINTFLEKAQKRFLLTILALKALRKGSKKDFRVTHMSPTYESLGLYWYLKITLTNRCIKIAVSHSQ